MKKIIVWFRLDLRLADNPALYHAIKEAKTVIPLYIHSPQEEGEWQPGEATHWWLHHSLESFEKSLRSKGSDLIIRKGNSREELEKIISETNAEAVYWNRRYEPLIIERDTQIKSSLKEKGIEVKSFNSALLYEPWTIKNQQEKPYQVFTPYWKATQLLEEPPLPLPTPKKITSPKNLPDTLNITELNLLPKIDWAGGMRKSWHIGETAAQNMIESFSESIIAKYHTDRDHPDRIGTSRISPYLHFGEISPRTIWHCVSEKLKGNEDENYSKNAWHYLREIGWREFSYHLLYHFPNTTNQPLKENFSNFPWSKNDVALKAWQKGQTGYPIVDAGMRELWATGWMHNRVRMIAASFLIKDLMIHWLEGARWFWDTLVDADLANNTMGWQWTAGSGADAAPYFRIFNPISQGEKFDPNGEYVRKWIPEIASLSNKLIHKPWEATELDLAEANIVLGETYPHPIVDHAEARNIALDAYQKIK